MTTSGRNAGERTENGPNGDKAAQIVEKAIELFNRSGYERVKVSDITDALKIGKGTLYLYFKNKKELLLECFRQLGLMISSIDESPHIHGAEGFFERLRPRFAGAHEQYIKLSRGLNLIRLCSESTDPEIRQCAKESYRAIIEPLKKDLELAIRQGVARPVNAEIAVCGLVGFAESIVWNLGDRYSAQEIDDVIIDLAERALRSSGTQTSTIGWQALSVTITHRSGARTDVTQIRFDGNVTLRGILGNAEIEVDPARVRSIAICQADGIWFADITTKDGAGASLQVEPNVAVSAQTAVGTLRIALRDVSMIVCNDAPV
jgi:AcrR family transcriptional regulator